MNKGKGKEVDTEGECSVMVTREGAIITTWGGTGAKSLAPPNTLKTLTMTKGKEKGREPIVCAALLTNNLV